MNYLTKMMFLFVKLCIYWSVIKMKEKIGDEK